MRFEHFWYNSVEEIHRSLKRDNCLPKIGFISRFYWTLELKEYLEKMKNLPKHHGAGLPDPEARGPPEGREPIQLHRLHWLKAGPVCHTTKHEYHCVCILMWNSKITTLRWAFKLNWNGKVNRSEKFLSQWCTKTWLQCERSICILSNITLPYCKIPSGLTKNSKQEKITLTSEKLSPKMRQHPSIDFEIDQK